MVKVLIETLNSRNKNNDEFIIALTGDHTTPLISGDHTFEPVPFTASTFSSLIENLGIDKSESKRLQELRNLRDTVERFDEISACEGVLGRFPGSEMMGILKKFKKSVESVIERTG
jgi:2,3-bisphosphoglycerate-independent phosphoglycerate mutase